MALSEIRLVKRDFTREELDGPKGPTGYPENFNNKIFHKEIGRVKPPKTPRR